MGSRLTGSCMSLQPSLSNVTFKRGNISTCFDSLLVSMDMKFVSQFCKMLTNVCTTSSFLPFLCFLPPTPPPRHTRHHIKTSSHSLAPFLFSSLTFSLLSMRPGTACRTQEDKVVSISSFFVCSLCCECDDENQQEQQQPTINQNQT